MKNGAIFYSSQQTKKEYVRPLDIGCGAKLWEWCAGRGASIFPYLLRRSNDSGGGDVHHRVPDPQYAGRWAGDEVQLIGDYDSSGLYDKAKVKFTNLSNELVAEYNKFIETEERKLRSSP